MYKIWFFVPFHGRRRHALNDAIYDVLLIQLKVQRPMITFIVTLLELDQIVHLCDNEIIGYSRITGLLANPIVY